jgi:hypothetical protein
VMTALSEHEEQLERLNARVVELLAERDRLSSQLDTAADFAKGRNLQLVDLQRRLASAEQSIREGDGMDYFGQRFDRALDRAEAAERQLASIARIALSLTDENSK